MKTAMQQLIDEIVEHLTYDDDLSDDSRITLETIRLRCLGKLLIEKEQLADSWYAGDEDGPIHDFEDYYQENFLLIETEQILALKKENEELKAEIKVLREKSYSQNKFSEKHVNELVKQIEFGVAKQK